MTEQRLRPVVLITGAGRREGIGFEVARQLAARGYRIILTARSAEDATARAEDLRKAGHDVRGSALDITSGASVARMQSELSHGGTLDVLINNAAGVSRFGEQPSNADLDSARQVLDATLFGTWRVIQALLPMLLASAHPRIVNVSSGAGSHGDSLFGLSSRNDMGPGYAIAKASMRSPRTWRKSSHRLVCW